jgi:hypothetical protein
VACLPVLLLFLSVLLCLSQSAAVSSIMSRTHSSPGPRLEALREELREKERFMSHGYQSFQYLVEALKSQCTTVWTKDTVAYRCRTCHINDSSAICEICFHQGDHKFHDFSKCSRGFRLGLDRHFS